MAGKSVAAEADVQTQPGTAPFTGAASGTWTAGPIAVTSYSKLTIGSQPAISEASCTFSFTGVAPDGTTAVSGSESVTLSAEALGTTKLQGQEQQVLRDGDQSTTSSYGNVIKIVASEKLSSA